MRTLRLAGAFILIATGADRAAAHGVRHRLEEGATVVRVSYDDGTPMAFCDVAVFAPQAGDDAYQTGITDRNGCFAFVPDASGTWKVTVDDGAGHFVKTNVAITEQGRQQANEAVAVNPLSGAAVGVSILFGCFGLYALVANGKRRSDRATETGES